MGDFQATFFSSVEPPGKQAHPMWLVLGQHLCNNGRGLLRPDYSADGAACLVQELFGELVAEDKLEELHELAGESLATYPEGWLYDLLESGDIVVLDDPAAPSGSSQARPNPTSRAPADEPDDFMSTPCYGEKLAALLNGE
jgi:hypothetical protein